MTAPGDPQLGGLRAARIAVSVYCLMQGIASASWYARIPDVKHRLGVSNGVLGSALVAAAVGTLLGLIWVGRAVDRIGSGRVARPAALVFALGVIGPGIAPDTVTLV